MPKIVIAAGGTAGHVVPALAVADALRARGAEVEFIGGERAEAELIPAAGYPFHRVRVRGLDRRRPVRAALALLLAAGATLRAVRLLRAARGGRRPGRRRLRGRAGRPGRAADAAAAGADRGRQPPGRANRLLAPVAKRVFLAFPPPRTRAAPAAPRAARKWVVSGRPVPAATGQADRAGAAPVRHRPGGGRACSCSAARSARAASTTRRSRRSAPARPAPCSTPAAGATSTTCAARLDELGAPPYYHLHAYIEPFADALAAADLVVARAGGSVMELAAAGLPAVLVPFPYATADHQTSNARFIEQAGAAVVVPDAELDGPRLAREVGTLLAPRSAWARWRRRRARWQVPMRRSGSPTS